VGLKQAVVLDQVTHSSVALAGRAKRAEKGRAIQSGEYCGYWNTYKSQTVSLWGAHCVNSHVLGRYRLPMRRLRKAYGATSRPESGFILPASADGVHGQTCYGVALHQM
jgi:hypothetical protein